jgi:hypothetical protein
MMKPILELSLSGSRRSLVALVVLAASACGVAEHRHDDAQPLDTSHDLDPPGGTPVTVPVAGSSAGGASSTGGTLPVMTAGGAGGVGVAGGVAVTAGTTSSAAAGGPSGATITLGGVSVPKEKAIAFINIGHSNMAGQATSPPSSRAFHYETAPRAFMYRAGSQPTLALEPSTAGKPGPGAGPGTALVKEAAMAAPDYYFITMGYGQPSAYCKMFLPGTDFYTALIAAPKAAKGKVTFGGIFIYLGITERHGTAADVEDFPNCINKLVTAIRTDIGEPNLPALMNDYEVDGKGEFIVTGAVATAIMPQIAKCPSVVSNFALVSADNVGMEDDHHFNFDGQRLWVQRAFQTMKDKGWRFWAP